MKNHQAVILLFACACQAPHFEMMICYSDKLHSFKSVFSAFATVCLCVL